MAEERVQAVDAVGVPLSSPPAGAPTTALQPARAATDAGAGPAAPAAPAPAPPRPVPAPPPVPSPAPGPSPAAPATEPRPGRGREGAGAAAPRHRQASPSEGLPATSRVLSRIARFGSGRGGSTSPLLEPLLRAVRATHPKADLSVLERAFEVAARAHSGQKRKSGDPYITHPVAVAAILAELGMTPPTLAAALLHDTVEDTSYTLEQLRTEFGDEIAMLVDGVTKLD